MPDEERRATQALGDEPEPQKGEDNYQFMFMNQKRTYDVYQDLDLERARSNNRNADNLNNIAQQALQNAVEVAKKVSENAADTQNLVNKQACAHRDIAINAEWNLEPSQGAAEAAVLKAGQLDNTALAAINAAVAAAIAEAFTKYSPKA